MESDEPTIMSPPAQNLWTNLSSFGKFWEFGIQHFPSFPQACRARELGVGRSLRSQAMGRFSGQNFSKFVWRIVANSYQGMVKGSLWGSAWVENVRNPNIEQQNSSLWSLGCWLLGWKSSAIFSASLLGMPHSSLHLAHSWFHHVSEASLHPQSKGSKMKGHPTINFPKTSIKELAKKLYVYISHPKQVVSPTSLWKVPFLLEVCTSNPPPSPLPHVHGRKAADWRREFPGP